LGAERVEEKAKSEAREGEVGGVVRVEGRLDEVLVLGMKEEGSDRLLVLGREEERVFGGGTKDLVSGIW